MSDITPHRSSTKRRAVTAAALLASGTLAGGILAGTLSASASSGSSTATGTTSTTTTATTPKAPATGPIGGATPVRSDEKSVGASTYATLKAAALKAVPGGTVYRIETDAGDGVYEAHMTKADGTRVTVKFNSSLQVTKVEAGMGSGDPRVGPAGPGPGAPGSSGSTGSSNSYGSGSTSSGSTSGGTA